MTTQFRGLRRTGSTMALIGAAAAVLLVAVIIIRLARGVLEPDLLWWLLPWGLWCAVTGVALTHTLTRGDGTTTLTTYGRTIRTIADRDVVALRMRGRRFEVSAGGREVCSILTGHGVGLGEVLASYRDLAVAEPHLVAADPALRRWAWHESQSAARSQDGSLE